MGYAHSGGTNEEGKKGIEDPFVWHDGQQFQLIAKDLSGTLSGRFGDGIHATSHDGIAWDFSDPILAWSRDLQWSDGEAGTIGSLERPQLLLNADGQPTHMFCAMADGAGGFRRANRTWNQVFTL